MKIVKSILWLAFNVGFCFAIFAASNGYSDLPKKSANEVVGLSVACGAFLTLWCSSWWARTEKSLAKGLRSRVQYILNNMIRPPK